MWDLFISHASEDKDEIARPLADELMEAGLKVWFDEYELTVGDSLRRSIDRGLAQSRFGVVILSEHFFAKEWPQKELDGLVAREDGSEKRILPVWHKVNRKQVVSFSPPLADKLGVPTTKGVGHVVKEILRVVKPDGPVLPTKPKAKAVTRSQPVKKAKERTTSKGTWVLLGNSYFQASSVQHTGDGDFILEVIPSTGDEEADLESLRPSQYGSRSTLPFAVRNDAQSVRVTKCEKHLVVNTAKWTLTLKPENGRFGSNGIEATINENGKTLSPDQIAQLRAGRILLNDPSIAATSRSSFGFSLLESAITGSGHEQVEDSIIRSVFELHKNNPNWKEFARLQAVYLLRATGTVEHILELTISAIRSGQVAVTFRGRRAKHFSNEPATVIEVSGKCRLEK